MSSGGPPPSDTSLLPQCKSVKQPVSETWHNTADLCRKLLSGFESSKARANSISPLFSANILAARSYRTERGRNRLDVSKLICSLINWWSDNRNVCHSSAHVLSMCSSCNGRVMCVPAGMERAAGDIPRQTSKSITGTQLICWWKKEVHGFDIHFHLEGKESFNFSAVKSFGLILISMKEIQFRQRWSTIPAFPCPLSSSS